MPLWPCTLLTVACALCGRLQVGFTGAELRNAGFTASELSQVGYSAQKLKDAGFSPKDLKTAGFKSASLGLEPTTVTNAYRCLPMPHNVAATSVTP